jgi:hypothetical protein
VGIRMFPCFPLISPSLLRRRLSSPALFMLLSVVPEADSLLPSRLNGNNLSSFGTYGWQVTFDFV